MNPVGQVNSNQSIWRIQYSNIVRRPSSNAYIRFYSNSTNTSVYTINVRTDLNDTIYSNITLIFYTSIVWNPVSYSLLSFIVMNFFSFRMNSITFYLTGIQKLIL